MNLTDEQIRQLIDFAIAGIILSSTIDVYGGHANVQRENAWIHHRWEHLVTVLPLSVFSADCPDPYACGKRFVCKEICDKRGEVAEYRG